MTEQKTATIKIDEALHYEAKVEAIRERKTLQQWIEEAIRAKLKKGGK